MSQPPPMGQPPSDGPPWAFFVGPDKAGSSWLQQLAEWHPAVDVPVAKETFFFDRYPERGWSWYLGQFRGRGSAAVRLEVCHDYLFDPAVPGRMAPLDVRRVVACARHPVDRARSAYLYMRRQGRVSLPFDRAVREVEELVDHGRYAHHLQPYLDRFGRGRVALLDFDELAHDPAGFADAFLGAIGVPLPEGGYPPEVLAPVRRAARARLQPVATAAKRAADAMRELGLERPLGRLKRSPTIERLLFRRLDAGERPTLDASLLAELEDRLRPDAQRLDALFGTDFEHRWWDDGGTGR